MKTDMAKVFPLDILKGKKHYCFSIFNAWTISRDINNDNNIFLSCLVIKTIVYLDWYFSWSLDHLLSKIKCVVVVAAVVVVVKLSWCSTAGWLFRVCPASLYPVGGIFRASEDKKSIGLPSQIRRFYLKK